MLRFITDLANPLLEFVKDDPVRPEIPVENRVGKNKLISSFVENEKPKAMVCISFHDFIPTTVADLAKEALEPNTAIFYTIWSYVPGAGQELLRETVDQIREQFPNITRFVTLSPKTATARRFHIRNGASVLRENEETVNYEYKVVEL